ncbi:hypothetical protein BpHYR1_046053 [Brachionus plicatilis]|uniref:Uncharacterized protein n=1 Tax=Brachionus plicatilis TaxID=10195 RepID=A0A3M7R0R4_BRAPC|nr:hypothetical protein BpHYR1_046053 [Brachionus plicatilis]
MKKIGTKFNKYIRIIFPFSSLGSLLRPLFFTVNLYCLQPAVAEAEYFELKPGVGAEIEVGYLNHLKHNALITGIVESELE